MMTVDALGMITWSSHVAAKTLLRAWLWLRRARAIHCRNCDIEIDLDWIVGGFQEFGCPSCEGRKLLCRAEHI